MVINLAISPQLPSSVFLKLLEGSRPRGPFHKDLKLGTKSFYALCQTFGKLFRCISAPKIVNGYARYEIYPWLPTICSNFKFSVCVPIDTAAFSQPYSLGPKSFRRKMALTKIQGTLMLFFLQFYEKISILRIKTLEFVLPMCGIA